MVDIRYVCHMLMSYVAAAADALLILLLIRFLHAMLFMALFRLAFRCHIMMPCAISYAMPMMIFSPRCCRFSCLYADYAMLPFRRWRYFSSAAMLRYAPCYATIFSLFHAYYADTPLADTLYAFFDSLLLMLS